MVLRVAAKAVDVRAAVGVVLSAVMVAVAGVVVRAVGSNVRIARVVSFVVTVRKANRAAGLMPHAVNRVVKPGVSAANVRRVASMTVREPSTTNRAALATVATSHVPGATNLVALTINHAPGVIKARATGRVRQARVASPLVIANLGARSPGVTNHAATAPVAINPW